MRFGSWKMLTIELDIRYWSEFGCCADLISSWTLNTTFTQLLLYLCNIELRIILCQVHALFPLLAARDDSPFCTCAPRCVVTPVGSWHWARPLRVLACCLWLPAHSVWPIAAISKFSFLPLKCCLLHQRKYMLFFYQYITMPLTPFISSIMELTVTRVCITTQKSLELFGKNKKMKRNIFFLVSLASLCPGDHSELPLKVSFSLRSSKAFILTKWKSDIWKVKRLKHPSFFFFFMVKCLSAHNSLKSIGILYPKEQAHNMLLSIDSFSLANISHKTLFFLSDFLFFDAEWTDLPRYVMSSKDEREVVKHAGRKTLKGCIHAFFILPKTSLLSCRLMKRKTGMGF